MANEKQLNPPNLATLVRAGSNAKTAAKPNAESQPEKTIDLCHLYGERGGLVGTSPTAGGEPVDLSDLYGEHGSLLEWPLPTAVK